MGVAFEDFDNKMRKKVLLRSILALSISIYCLGGCHKRITDTSEKGKLSLIANGEDFIKEGFVAKDGWRVDFTKVNVTVDKITAYQTDPPFNAEKDEKMAISAKIVLLDTPTTVNLAADNRILVAQVEASPGFYNALSWQIATAGPAENNTILLAGKAEKNERKINFAIALKKPVQYTCGEFVGQDRKGFLTPQGKADLEITFHFDHLFGDGEKSSDDKINLTALGFAPFANLAENGAIKADMTTLKNKLSAREYQKLERSLTSLGHVGEGHCAKQGNF